MTYQDVQRAVQDGMRQVQSDMQRLTNNVANISNQANYIDDLQHSLQNIESEISRHDPRSEVALQQIQRDVQDLKQRFDVVEKFCQDMSEYMHARKELDKEDQEYRSVGSQ